MANGNFGGGDGTELRPFLVEDEHDFLAIQNITSPSLYFLQKRDLDFSSIAFTRITKALESYDGGSFSIKNINSTINLATSSSFSVGGVFNEIVNIKNLFLENVHITIRHTGSMTTGSGLAAILALSVAGAYNVHGKNCSLYSFIQSTNNNKQSGGFIGTVTRIEVSSFDGNIHVNNSRGGSVGGLAYYAGSVIDCYTTGSVYMEVSRDSYYDHLYLGGLVARCIDVRNSYSSATVNFSILRVNKIETYTTALSCLIGQASGTISNCFYLGKGMVNKKYTSGYGIGFDYHDISGTPNPRITNSYCIDTAILRGE